MNKYEKHLKALGVKDKEKRNELLEKYQPFIEKADKYFDYADLSSLMVEKDKSGITAEEWWKELKLEHRLREIDNALQFYGINDTSERKLLMEKYSQVIKEVGLYFDGHRMVHMLLEMHENNVSEEQWLSKIENDKKIIQKWQPKWREFIQSLHDSFPVNVSKYFEGTELIFGYKVILALARPLNDYNLILKRENGEIIKMDINDAGWKQISIIDDKYNIFSNKRGFDIRFKVDVSVEKQFYNALEQFGQKTFCTKMNNLCDQYKRENKDTPKAELERRERKAVFYTSFLQNILKK